uniref:Uncharacterized protein n=1 Tax=Compsopogon caeruleus TaxID=31354 RepID=A0A7S1XG39_9RHOD|mmetsp:Transcript_5841/g.11541  ORF Transcript_5841/g.11541 Transcript_5841/m.11541 type:complete len:218 (+) Transcript_5841:142-795(+)
MESLKPLLPSEEWEQVALSRTNRPAVVVTLLGQQLRFASEECPRGSREEEFLVSLSNSLPSEMFRIQSVCEMIIKTPVPLSYSHHAARFVAIWIFTLPLVLTPKCGFAVVPVTTCLGWALYGIKELAATIEQPFDFPLRRKGPKRRGRSERCFSKLHLDDFCSLIDSDLEQFRILHGSRKLVRIEPKLESQSTSEGPSVQVNHPETYIPHDREKHLP